MDLLALGDVASGNMSGISDSSKIHLSAGYQWVKVIENRVQALGRKVMTWLESISQMVQIQELAIDFFSLHLD